MGKLGCVLSLGKIWEEKFFGTSLSLLLALEDPGFLVVIECSQMRESACVLLGPDILDDLYTS